MRAVVLTSEGHVEIIDTEMPANVDADCVLIRVRAVGVCGSEVHAYQGTHPFRKAPVILGHEMAGDVLEVGTSVTAFAIGDRVIVEPQWVCGDCAYCRAGDENLCPSKRVLGTPVWPGAFGEVIVAPQDTVFHLPSSLSYVQGALIEPLSVAVHVARRANVAAGDSAVILGSGSIGGSLAAVCSVQGAGPIVVTDIHQHCLDVALARLGATHGFLMPETDLTGEVLNLTQGEGADVVIIAGDDVAIAKQAVDVVKRRGRIVLVALLTEYAPQLVAYDILNKELHVIGSTMSTHEDTRRAIELVESGQVDVEAIATHVLPIDDAQRGIELARTKADGAIKVVFTFE